MKNALQKIGLYFDYDSKPEWVAYPEVCEIIVNIATQNGLSLWEMDWAWWQINKVYDFEKLYNFITKINDTNGIWRLLVIKGFLEKGQLSKAEIDTILNSDTACKTKLHLMMPIKT